MSDLKIYISSLGCSKNLVDAELMSACLVDCGFEITATPAEAELILINTCAFIQPAKEESIEEILRLASYKDPATGSCRYLVVTGCLPQRYPKDLPKLLPEVDLFLGVGEIDRVGNHLRNLVTGSQVVSRTIVGKPTFLMSSHTPRLLATPPHSAYLKIAEGCSNCCSYCVIPTIRGQARSRSLADLVCEAKILAASGVKELNLIAQDITCWGQDQPGKPTLNDLLQKLVAIEGIQWIRLLYAHPAGLDRRLMETMAREDKICKYLDLPIQHIDERILTAMNRRGDAAMIKRVIAELRQQVAGIALRTSLIVGFPGETMKEFRRLLDFVKETKFDHLGVFVYSREEGTPAALFPKQVSRRLKEERRRIIMEEQAIISYRINRGLIGSRQRVLVEEKSERPDYRYIGRLARQAPEIDGVTYLKGGNPAIGSLVAATVVAAEEYDLFAEISEE